MSGFRLAVACAAFASIVSTAPAAAQTAPLSAAATLWHLRAGLNVAALACRGDGEAAIVAGYNRLLADHRDELSAAYSAVTREFGNPAAYDEAMTRLYNLFAQPGAQTALCDNALTVLDAVAARGELPLGEVAADALTLLVLHDAPAAPPATTDLALASIPQILPDLPPTE
ncbi:MAG: hypothetical protein V4659_09285 [Pseudomonadota bacterium]